MANKKPSRNNPDTKNKSKQKQNKIKTSQECEQCGLNCIYYQRYKEHLLKKGVGRGCTCPK